MDDFIHVVGAYQNNLKNITVDIPKHRWVTITGVSGSGKSSLVFDVLYAQAQKEFLESLSSYARRSLPRVGEINVEQIRGLSPCIVIDQASFPNTPRSTVGTYTDVYSHLRLLFSRAGDSDLSAADFSFNNALGSCTLCSGLGEALIPDLHKLLRFDLSLNEGAIQHKTWKVGSRYWNIIRAINYFDMDKKLADFTEEEMSMLLYRKPFVYQNDEPGHIQTFSYEGIISRLRKRKADSRGLSVTEYDDGFFAVEPCPKCRGTRLNQRAMSVKIANGLTIGDCVNMEIQNLYEELAGIHGNIADRLIPIIRKALKSLIDVGVGYLTLNRAAHTLSGGEAQKVKLAKALGCSLTDMIYILDEPTAGLHPMDVYKMRAIVRGMVDAGNTVLTIEHNQEMIRASDTVIDMGLGAGKDGGEIIYQGNVAGLEASKKSLTSKYLRSPIARIRDDVRMPHGYLTLRDIRRNNVLLSLLKIPTGVFVVITGVSGAGKSTILEEVAERDPNSILVDQNAIGSNPRGNIATYSRAFNGIREYFSAKTGLNPSDFSFNSTGSCEMCGGLGYTVTDMHFIGDIRTPCELCGGKRYKKYILSKYLREKNISDILDMTVVEAISFFDGEPKICEKLESLRDVGLEYVCLGQPLSTLSGGELQRLKLAEQISSKSGLYLFDEPTRGLHPRDTARMIAVMNQIVDRHNTVIVVEHNMDVIAQADWIIDMGPYGGKNGGKIIFEGTPSDICRCSSSYTGQCLRTRFD